MAKARHSAHQLRSLAGRIGGYRLAATHDPRETTRPAREAFARRFIDQVDPHRKLPEKERLRRAEAAKKAHMAQLALKSAVARRRTTGRRSGG